MGYNKGYKIFIADENFFVSILIYFNKNIHFQWITKKYKNYKIKLFLKYKFYCLMNWAIKIISKTLMTKISHISWGELRQRLLRYFIHIFWLICEFYKIYFIQQMLDSLKLKTKVLVEQLMIKVIFLVRE